MIARYILPGLMLALSGAGGMAQTSDLVSTTALRVCADPANMPQSDKSGAGYENRIAEVIADELGVTVEYTWFPMTIGFVRRTLKPAKCDVIIGFAQGHELVQNTNHYYTSTHILVTRTDSPVAGADHLSDPRLAGRPIGVIAGSPASSHMSNLGMMSHAHPYQMMVDRRIESPNEQMLRDLQSGKIDAAVMWGPIGGPLAKQAGGLTVQPMLKEVGPPKLYYRITMGVRLGEQVWKRKLNSTIRKRQADIDAILHEAGVPLLTDMGDALKEE